MKHRNRPGVRCINCGCYLDSGERCDCEQREAERREQKKHAERQAIIAHNIQMMAQAQQEWDYA